MYDAILRMSWAKLGFRSGASTIFGPILWPLNYSLKIFEMNYLVLEHKYNLVNMNQIIVVRSQSIVVKVSKIHVKYLQNMFKEALTDLNEKELDHLDGEYYKEDDDGTLYEEVPGQFQYLDYMRSSSLRHHITRNETYASELYGYENKEEAKKLWCLKCFVYVILLLIAVYTVVLIIELSKQSS
ncbi:uncharacterized protein LOC142235906 [Haematobia irritans]|uniref:uncharacterized protein LOC142235906 n=1 Tax=Haematobia irritans TaxID=7368 RepID=UPI003F4FFF30